MTASSPSPQIGATAMAEPRFRITRIRRQGWLASGLAVLLSLVGMALCWSNPRIGAPLRPGLDFTGGTQLQIERSCSDTGCASLTAGQVQQRLAAITLPAAAGAEAPRLSSAGVQVLDGGRSLELRLPDLEPEQTQALLTELTPLIGVVNPEQLSVNTIGPSLGSQLLRSSAVSLLVSFALIAAYISFRYDGIYAGLALLCLAHDVLITCGVFAWLGLLRGVEVDSLFAVALITVAGYSVNDTVVVFDRIREQRREFKDVPMNDQVDLAVDATLTRSIYTSLTTLLPLIALLLFGGGSLFWFAVALTVGIGVGSWSSIGIAPTLLPLLARR
ncbi:MAG: protein translocase subunit SecF [Vulcanococcus sp.]|uniref:protein translocase subunit SecF n=1 Tax=Vulcanococcus sp. TaxID=2856995 RepID=UPI0025EC860D|nr:protein translocase subunit SecF [Vulcanococcus sp.]MBW0167845.1 protein translocase subunit SecF [Vulcanococcus sp.]